MAWIALFYLLWPGEYCKSQDNNPLRLQDITLVIGYRKLDLLQDDQTDILWATHSLITFDDQNNRERGKVIGHGRSGHTVACPTQSIIRRVLYLRTHGATAATPLCAVKSNTNWKYVANLLMKQPFVRHPHCSIHLTYYPLQWLLEILLTKWEEFCRDDMTTMTTLRITFFLGVDLQ